MQPEFDHVAEIGKTRADCLLRAYSLEGQPLSPAVVEEISLNVALNMESAATSLIARKRNEIQLAQSHPSFAGVPPVDQSEVSLRVLTVQRETKEQLQRLLTIRMYETSGGGHRKMPRTAVVLNVLIASPSDVSEERDIVTDAVYAWNAAHFRPTGIMLQPIRWETHSFPASGDRPQAIINRQITDEGDFLIGIFGYRLGTPTGEAQSGTIEEIERFRKAGKHVALYFSTADVPREADRDQLKALEDYQRERQKDSLYATFKTSEELRRLVSQHLPLIVNNVRKGLRSSHALEGLEEELRNTQIRSEQRLSELAGQSREPLRLSTEFVGEYPDGPRLRLRANRNIILSQIDYLDERDVKIASETTELGGMAFDVPLDYQQFLKIHNMKRSSGREAIPIGFRLHVLDGDKALTERIPAALQPSYKPNTLTYFFKLLG